LYRRLIYDRRVASEVGAVQTSREITGTFQLLATAAPGRSLEELHAAMCEEIARLAAEGPAEDELERGRAQAEAVFIYRLQSLGGFGGKADQLNAYNTYRGDPHWFDADLDRYLSATGDAIRTAVVEWLDPARAALLSVVPQGGTDLGLPDSVRLPEGL